MRYPSEPIVHYVLTGALVALEECGCLNILRGNTSGITAERIAEKLLLEQFAVTALCDFIVINAPDVLMKKEDNYIPQKLLFDPGFQNNLYFFLSYRSIVSVFPDILRGNIEYGRDVVRNAVYLQKSSSIHNIHAYKTIIKFLTQLKPDVVVDVGCGRGDFLVEAYKTLSASKMLGVEIDNKTVVESADFLRRHHIDTGVSIIHGDAARPAEWVDTIKAGGGARYAIVGVTLWHEFLNRKETLPVILKRYRACFPKGFFITSEFNGIAIDDFSSLPEGFRGMASFYQLVHPLSNQGVPPSVSTWQRFFEENGVSIIDIVPTKNNMTTYVGVLVPLES